MRVIAHSARTDTYAHSACCRHPSGFIRSNTNYSGCRDARHRVHTEDDPSRHWSDNGIGCVAPFAGHEGGQKRRVGRLSGAGPQSL